MYEINTLEKSLCGMELFLIYLFNILKVCPAQFEHQNMKIYYKIIKQQNI